MGVNKYGVGEPLESIAVKALDPFTVPSPPTSLEITSVSKDSITLCWARPESDGGNEIAGYVIERREKTSLRWIRVNKKPVYDLRVKSSGLREGCEYEFRVYAENAAGLSPPSEATPLIRAEDPLFLASPPSKPKIIDSTRSNITIGWTKPLFDGGAPVTGYAVEYKKTDETDWSTAIQNLRGTEYTVTGLTSGSEYVFRVKSINKVGVSEPSDVSEPHIAKEREEEPAFDIDSEMRKTLIVKAGGSFTMTVPFRGKPIPNVSWNKPETDLRTRASIDTSDNCTSLTIEKATRNDSGKYTLTLQNVLNTATLTLVVKVLDTPGPPSNIATKDVTKESAVLSWDVPENDGGAPVKNYVIEKREASKKAWVTVTNNCHRLSYKVTGLQEGAIYYFRLSVVEFRVFAKNEKGMSDGVTVGPITVKEYTITPEADLSDIPGGQISVRIGHNLHIELPYKGKPKPSMSWLKDNLPLKETEQLRFKKTENKISLSIKNVKKEHGGKYTLILDNMISRKSFTITVITLGPPSKPKGPLRLDEIKADSVVLSWEAPEDDGGGEITGYSIEKRETSQLNWKLVCSSAARTTFKVPNLVKDTEYQFRVRAENRYGVSPPLVSADVVAKHQFRPPGAPGKPVVYNVTADGMTISWDAPAYDGGSEILGYHVEKKERNSILWQKVNVALISSREYRITGLLEGLEYQFQVYAENTAGLSRASEPSKFTLAVSPVALPDAPGTPEPTNVTGNSITLTWARPKSDGGSEINEYILERREKKSMRWVKVSSKRPIAETRYRVTGLIEGNEYEFHVMAENAAGVGPPSDVSKLIKCREPVSPPSAPNVVKVTDTSKTSVSLEWTKPVFDGGMEIIGYIIEMCKADLEAWQKVNAETVLATKYTVVDLEAGEHYKFRVSAVNGAGKGESCEVPAAVQTVDRLSAPEIDIDANFKQTHIVRAGASIRLFIAFSGRPTPTAVWSKADANLSLRADIQTTDSFSTLTVEECNRNDAGKYVFTVENNSGSKSITFTVKVLDTPGPPGPITFKDVTRGSITLMWDAPVLDGGSRSDYWVEAGQTKQLTFTVEGLTENSEYEFRVKAKNDAGYSQPREAFSSVIIKEPQIEPTADLSEISRQLITCKAGSAFTIDIPISGRPAPKVTWKLEEMRLKETERVTIKTTKDRTTLTVKDSMRGDSGKYYLTLENTCMVSTATIAYDYCITHNA
uniref:Titin n=1 Tax=Nothoprocta perdicaria TaxID=30464 RepID=A0A8C6ZZ25_NOTPE